MDMRRSTGVNRQRGVGVVYEYEEKRRCEYTKDAGVVYEYEEKRRCE